jgi:hypothetical protein
MAQEERIVSIFIAKELRPKREAASSLLDACLLGLLLDPEDGNSTFLPNVVSKLLPDYTVSHPTL